MKETDTTLIHTVYGIALSASLPIPDSPDPSFHPYPGACGTAEYSAPVYKIISASRRVLVCGIMLPTQTHANSKLSPLLFIQQLSGSNLLR